MLNEMGIVNWWVEACFLWKNAPDKNIGIAGITIKVITQPFDKILLQKSHEHIGDISSQIRGEEKIECDDPWGGILKTQKTKQIRFYIFWNFYHYKDTHFICITQNTFKMLGISPDCAYSITHWIILTRTVFNLRKKSSPIVFKKNSFAINPYLQ